MNIFRRILNLRYIIGLVEPIVLENNKEYKAKIDTGADYNSIDENLVKKLPEKKIVFHKQIKSALGISKRPFIELEFEFAGRKIKDLFSIANRKEMKYKILIGKDLMQRENFLVDPLKEVYRKWVKKN